MHSRIWYWYLIALGPLMLWMSPPGWVWMILVVLLALMVDTMASYIRILMRVSKELIDLLEEDNP